jgi:molybdopterin molybdotransferase
MVKDVLRADGSVSVCQVQMKPGRPLAIGTINEIPMIGLPGNPAAAYVSFLQFAWPAIRRLLGSARPSLDEIDAVLDAPVSDRQGRRTFVRGVLESRGSRMTVTPAVRQGSAMIRGLVESNCLIVIPEGREHVSAGDLVSVQLLPDARLSHSQRRT